MTSINIQLVLLLLLTTACGLSPSSTSQPVLLSGVSSLPTLEVPQMHVDNEDLELQPLLGQWFYAGQPFTGQAQVMHTNGAIAESITYLQGKKDGPAKKWYPDGTLQKQFFFTANRLHGQVKIWSPNRQLVVEANYKNGQRHGLQRRWYPDGQLFRKRNIHLGKEQGLQQAWRKNGKIYVNYEAKNGRIFGIKQSSLCYELDDEIIQYGKK